MHLETNVPTLIVIINFISIMYIFFCKTINIIWKKKDRMTSQDHPTDSNWYYNIINIIKLSILFVGEKVP